MRPIRIGIQLHPQHGSYEGIRHAVARAEELGADLVYNWDHFFPLYGVAHDADAYVEMGFTQFTLGFTGPRWEVERGARWLAWRDRRNG